MRRLTHILVCILIGHAMVRSQQVYVEAGFSASSFENFMSASGESTLENSYSRPQEIGLGTGVLFNHFKDRIKLDAGLNFNQYRINTTLRDSNGAIPLFYEFAFFSVKAGIFVIPIKISGLNLRVHSHLSHSWLTNGTRTILNQTIDLLKEDNEFYDKLLNYHYGASLEYAISESTAIYLSLDIRKSFERNEPIDEPYQLRAQSLSVGLLFSIGTNKKEEEETSKKTTG